MDQDVTRALVQQFATGTVPTNSILAKIVGDLSEKEVESLRAEAAKGMMHVELERLRSAHRFQASGADINEFIQQIRVLEDLTRGGRTGFKATGEFNTASGRTVIQTTRRGCFVATAVYGSTYHPNVIALRRFRDAILIRHAIGRQFCAAYYSISPVLVDTHFFRLFGRWPSRALLDMACATLRLLRFRGFVPKTTRKQCDH